MRTFIKASALLLAFPLLFLAGPGVSHAQTVAINVTDQSTSYVGDGPWTLGYLVHVNQTISVTQLGYFDFNQDGLVENHAVGLWTSTGTLLTSGTVLAGTADPLVGFFRYANIAPIALTAGQNYVIGGTHSRQEAYLLDVSSAGFSTDPAITYSVGISDRFISGAALAFPTNNDPNRARGYFGPNFTFAPTTNVTPEGSSLALLATGVLPLALGLKRRFRRA